MTNSTDQQTVRLDAGLMRDSTCQASAAQADRGRERAEFPSADEAAGSHRTSSWSSWRGLLWCEWFAQNRLLLAFSLLWLVGVWVIPLVVNPGWILMLSAVYALLAGPAFGGGDTIEGCEEFSLSLPPGRGQRYLTRLAVGGGTVCLFTMLDLLVLGLEGFGGGANPLRPGRNTAFTSTPA